MTSCLSKNPDFASFSCPELLTARVQREFCPMMSVDVERSFSKFKHLLRDNRLSLTIEHIREHMIVNYNSSALIIKRKY